MQVPTPVPVSVLAAIEQKLLPLVTAKLTAPVPEPPVVESVLVVLKAMFDGVALAVRAA